MIPVDQLIVNEGGTQRPYGDCLRACVASILELDPADVPHFVEESDWFGALCRWTTGSDLTAAYIGGAPAFLRPGYAIGLGTSPRGDWGHAVVVHADTLQLAHDPHPSRAGLDGPPSAVVVITRGPR